MKKISTYFLFTMVFLSLWIGKEYLAFFLKQDLPKESYIPTQTYEELKSEYEKLLSFKENQDEEVLVSKVLFHDPTLFWDQLTILKGQQDGIEVGDIVFNKEGFIGKIMKTNENTSIVKLITNWNVVLPVRVLNSYGLFSKENENFIINKITSKETIPENTIVYTSKLSEIGMELPLAKVTKVINTSTEIKLFVTPLVDFEALDYVFIKKKVTYE